MIAIVVLAWSAFALAEPPRKPSAERTAEHCDDGTQVEAEECFASAAVKSRGEVDREFERDLRNAAAFDASVRADPVMASHPMVGFGLSLTEDLKVSQAAWVKYSNAQCMFEGRTSLGGSGTDILKAACHNRQNLSRLTELRAADKLARR